jgi:hypothetical protein
MCGDIGEAARAEQPWNDTIDNGAIDPGGMVMVAIDLAQRAALRAKQDDASTGASRLIGHPKSDLVLAVRYRLGEIDTRTVCWQAGKRRRIVGVRPPFIPGDRCGMERRRFARIGIQSEVCAVLADADRCRRRVAERDVPVLLRQVAHGAMLSAFHRNGIVARLKRHACANVSVLRRENDGCRWRDDRYLVAVVPGNGDIDYLVKLPRIAAKGTKRDRNVGGGKRARRQHDGAEHTSKCQKNARQVFKNFSASVYAAENQRSSRARKRWLARSAKSRVLARNAAMGWSGASPGNRGRTAPDAPRSASQ